MSRFFLMLGLGLTVVGCGDGGGVQDPVAVYEAVLERELGEPGNAAEAYLFIDGKAPPQETLDRLRERWPKLRAGSESLRGREHRVSLGELRWVGRNRAEVRGGFSNGMDGRSSLYHVVRKNGQWVVENVEVKAIS